MFKYEGIERSCHTCEYCMGNNEGYLVCAGGYDKKENKEPYYGQRIYDDETEEYLSSLEEDDQLDDNFCSSLLSDKFNGNCPCWDISFDSFIEYCKKNK